MQISHAFDSFCDCVAVFLVFIKVNIETLLHLYLCVLYIEGDNEEKYTYLIHHKGKPKNKVGKRE